MAIFPQADGDFSSLDLVTKSHYEVHGDSTTVERSEAVLPTAQPVRFLFTAQPAQPQASSVQLQGAPLKALLGEETFTPC